jgi:hypothetical protein
LTYALLDGLFDARNGGSRPGSDVADPEILDAAAAICPSLEGKTARQKNPHRPGSLSWLSWIVARLGGWNCYYKPPGPETMRAGWDKLAAMAAGYHLAMSVNHPNQQITSVNPVASPGRGSGLGTIG